jgi:uroporphyrinogen-III synthase
VSNRPLAGKRVVVTRPRAQAGELCDLLTARGAVPVQFPTIEIAPNENLSALDEAVAAGLAGSYQWIIFTSANGVAAFWSRLEARNVGPGLPATTNVAAIGPATASALRHLGVEPRFVPDEYRAEAIVEQIGDVRGDHILLPRADIAREMLAVELRRRGAVVDEISAYRTLPVQPDPAGLAELRRGVDAVTFTSSSTVRSFVAMFDGKTSPWDAAVIACIGPVTAETARQAGLPVHVEATEYTTHGLVAALADYFADQAGREEVQ